MSAMSVTSLQDQVPVTWFQQNTFIPLSPWTYYCIYIPLFTLLSELPRTQLSKQQTG